MPDNNGRRRTIKITKNKVDGDQEEVFDDGTQVINGCADTGVSESITTGAIAAAPSGVSPMKTRSNGKPIGGQKTPNKGTGGNSQGKSTDHGDPFKHKFKNKVNEHVTPTDIANTINDGGIDIQTVFDNYARGVTYVSLNEFIEIADAYGVRCTNEQSLMSLMDANNEFMFTEERDGSGRYWVPEPMDDSLKDDGVMPTKSDGVVRVQIISCPQCGADMDELGCPECEFVPDSDVSGDEMPIVSSDDEPNDLDYDDYAPTDTNAVAGYVRQNEHDGHDMDPMYFDESVKQVQRNMITESDGVAMDGPAGSGLEKHPGKSGGKPSGLPQQKGSSKDLGHPLSRTLKNVGGQTEETGHESRGYNDGLNKLKDISLGQTLKNKGGQWEKLSGGAKQMQENIERLSRHVRSEFTNYVRAKGIDSRNNKYPMSFRISAEGVATRDRNQLAEALLDAEELIQEVGPNNVVFEAFYHGDDGTPFMAQTVQLIPLSERGPIVHGGKIIFRYNEIAQNYADAVVTEGKSCRTLSHNWGAAVSADLTYKQANDIFRKRG